MAKEHWVTAVAGVWDKLATGGESSVSLASSGPFLELFLLDAPLLQEGVVRVCLITERPDLAGTCVLGLKRPPSSLLWL